MSTRVSSAGVEVSGYRFVIRKDEPKALRGSWIWTNADAATGYFRKTVTLASAPGEVIARVSADTVYRLYVNGQLVSPKQWLYDVRDLTTYSTRARM